MFGTSRPSFLARRSRPEHFRNAPEPPPAPDPAARYFLGLDLGPTSEPTALAVVERTKEPPQGQRRRYRYAVRHLQRFAGGTPYAEIIRMVAALVAAPPLKESTLVVDVTAVGQPVLELLYSANLDAAVVPVSLTAGQHAVTDERGWWLVPRLSVASRLQVLLQSQRLKVAESLPEAPLLVRELTNFKVRPVLMAADDVLAWREGEHDDLVLAVGIAVAQAETCSFSVAYWVA